MIPLTLLLIILIPATAIIDYFAFRKQFQEEYGRPMKWHYFITPCALEIGCFIAGYYIGSGHL